MSNRNGNKWIAMEDTAIQLIECGSLRRAERALKRMLAQDSNCLPAHFHLTRVYRRTKQFRLGLVHGRRTLRLNPNEPNACLNLGLIYECMGNDRRAVSYYRKELSRNPNSPETLFNIGRLYFNRHRWLQASHYLARCFETGFTFEIDDTVDKLGLCYFKMRDVQSYIALFTKFLEKFPSASWACANLGRALLYTNDYKRAAHWLSKARDSNGKKSVLRDLARAERMLAESQRGFRKKR